LATVVFLGVSLVVIALPVHAQETTQSEREAMYYRYLEFPSYVKGGSIEPHWMADASSFWYAEGAPASTVIYKVDPVANTKTPLFDTARLRQALTSVLGHEPPYQDLPFDKFNFVEAEQAVKFTVEDKEFILRLDTYSITRVPALSEAEKSRRVPQIARKGVYGSPDVMEVLSPDGRWFAGLNEHNVWLRSTTDGRSVPLTTDGVEDYEWRVSGAKWSPDSFKLAIRKVDYRNTPKSLIVHSLKPRPEVEWVRGNLGPGAPDPQTELFIVDILSKRQVRVDEDPDQSFALLGWRPDGSEMLFRRMDHGRKKLDLMAADPATGSTRVVATETQQTFVGSHRNANRGFTLLEDGKRFIWMSERDGWNHLYLYDLEGNLIRRLTEGSFPVAGRPNTKWVVAVDEKAGWVYFTAHAEKRLYDTHLYRVSLEGRGFTRLTEGTGHHAIRFAPSQQFFLDTHSSIGRPPQVELRRADGTLLQTLSRANIDALREELKWSPPEEFVVTAADGETDLYGVLYKPYDFDPNKQYPVIEIIYAGGRQTVVPRTFTSTIRGLEAQALAQLGFITFIVDGRGTPERSKAFQDVVYGNRGRHEIPDHVAALKQLAEERPYMDLNRVGIYGYSNGGYFTLRALLLAPDVYHVGIAGAPSPDTQGFVRFGQLGFQQDNKEGYDYASNLRFVGNLKGKLLLVHGTSDGNFFSTIKVVEALIQAGKPYDLLVLPEQHHFFRRNPGGTARTYFWQAIGRYFQEHLKPEG